MADITASVLSRLKNISREKQIQYQQLLNLFCHEEFLRRLSRFDYSDNFIILYD